MLEFIGVTMITITVICLYLFITSDELHIKIKIDGKEILKYDKKSNEEDNDEDKE